MKGLLTVTRDSFLLLRRDKIFVPAAIGGALITIFAILAGDWTIEDWAKVQFDIGTFGFNLIGSLVAIFWSTKSVADARVEGSLEVQIATPISRSTWLLGKYLGLVLSLTLLAAILLFLWQSLMLLNGTALMTRNQGLTFAYLYLGWCVLGSVGIFFASFCGQATSLFSSMCAWLIGLAIPYVVTALSPQTDRITRLIIERVAWAWDLQRFNLIEPLTSDAPGLQQLLQWNGLYGLALITLLLTTAMLIFRKKDLIT
jgi:ABC-type transport system involved in multi-copper enzyme maturation permease subunit